MQLKTSINTLPTTRWTSDLSKMNEELDKFENRITEPGTGKLIIDFSSIDMKVESNQISIGSIKYKKPKKKLEKKVVDLKSRKASSQNLF
jgi:hypothetical protein